MKRIVFVSTAIACLISSANAQLTNTPATTTPQAGQRYVVLGGTSQADSVGCYTTTGFCVNAEGINLSQFASTTDVSQLQSQISSTSSSVTSLQGQISTVNTSIATLQGQLTTANSNILSLQGQLGTVNATLAGVQTQLAANQNAIGKLYDLVAISAAMQDAIPNGDDRFALRVNMAGYGGHVAGGVGASYNFDQSVRFSFNYGLGRHEQMFSGGMNFSFH